MPAPSSAALEPLRRSRRFNGNAGPRVGETTASPGGDGASTGRDGRFGRGALASTETAPRFRHETAWLRRRDARLIGRDGASGAAPLLQGIRDSPHRAGGSTHGAGLWPHRESRRLTGEDDRLMGTEDRFAGEDGASSGRSVASPATTGASPGTTALRRRRRRFNRNDDRAGGNDDRGGGNEDRLEERAGRLARKRGRRTRRADRFPRAHPRGISLRSRVVTTNTARR